MSNIDLQKNILTTIAYYDVMKYPMTAFEVWKYLTAISSATADPISNEGMNNKNSCSLLDVMQELESEKLKNIIEEYNGFYFLKGRKDLVEQRLERNKIANQKLKKLLKTVKWLRYAPFVRMLAVTGSLAMKNAEVRSDLDLLVVLKHGRIFTGRLWVTLIAHLLGKRRHGNKINNRICLNYFITDQSLEISPKDLFSASEYSFIRPIFGWHNFQEFQKQNEWLKKYKPNFKLDEIPNLKFIRETVFSRRLRRWGETILSFNFMENILKKWQIKRIANDPRTYQAGSLVVANDEMLIFLPEPQGPDVFERFQKRLLSLK